ncbi:MAG TPA: hypothetical protein VLO11_02210 [Luteolibacter sp.]|nr:hypothetical protein [Luteolibacter sp.]
MPSLWSDDSELFALCRNELFTAVVGDVMDKLGLLKQFLPAKIQPLREDMVTVGRAMTLLEDDVYAEASPGSPNPLNTKHFGLMLEALDDLNTHEI